MNHNDWEKLKGELNELGGGVLLAGCISVLVICLILLMGLTGVLACIFETNMCP